MGGSGDGLRQTDLLVGNCNSYLHSLKIATSIYLPSYKLNAMFGFLLSVNKSTPLELSPSMKCHGEVCYRSMES